MKKPQRIEMSAEDLDALVARVKSGRAQEHDYQIIEAMAETIKLLSSAVQEKNTSIKRLLRMLFGAPTETSKNVLNEHEGDAEKTTSSSQRSQEEKKKPKGHGRNGAADYPGAEKVTVSHQSLKRRETCPLCLKGKVYPMKAPGSVLWIVGTAPVQVTIYELEKLRCNLCGKVFTADLPEECGKQKYDETVGSIIALLKYGSGFPFNRLEKLQGGFGIPLAASTQWEICDRKAAAIYPAYDEIVRQAAQGSVVYNDDTAAKILEFMSNTENQGEDDASRTGMFTTGILSQIGQYKIALYYTGRKHAGENMADLLSYRDLERGPPIQMCDALSRNLPKAFKVILANCLCHARRGFVDVTDVFPEESRFVLEILQKVYSNDAVTKTRHMSDKQRLKYHQSKSAPLMNDLKAWLSAQFEQKTVEPNSSLGQPISYMLKYWKPLTRFLEVPGAPLDNNSCEQVLKRAILHRKNALFFKTQHGAYVGDLFMSIIHTCNLNGINAFEYLTELERHSEGVRKNPQCWLPWNYKQNLSA